MYVSVTVYVCGVTICIWSVYIYGMCVCMSVFVVVCIYGVYYGMCVYGICLCLWLYASMVCITVCVYMVYVCVGGCMYNDMQGVCGYGVTIVHMRCVCLWCVCVFDCGICVPVIVCDCGVMICEYGVCYAVGCVWCKHTHVQMCTEEDVVL